MEQPGKVPGMVPGDVDALVEAGGDLAKLRGQSGQNFMVMLVYTSDGRPLLVTWGSVPIPAVLSRELDVGHPFPEVLEPATGTQFVTPEPIPSRYEWRMEERQSE